MREPGEYSEEVYTSKIKVTCDICYEKYVERERVRLEEESNQRAEQLNRARIRENFVVEEARERENNVVDSDIEERESLVPVVEIAETSESRRELADRICSAVLALHKLMQSPLHSHNNVITAYGR